MNLEQCTKCGERRRPYKIGGDDDCMMTLECSCTVVILALEDEEVEHAIELID